MAKPSGVVASRQCRLVVAVASSAVVVAALIGSCAPSGGARAGCLPAALTLTPTRAYPSEVVELQSAGFTCGYRYPSNHHYYLALSSTRTRYSRTLGSYPVNRDGRFVASIQIPADAPPGRAELIVVAGSPYNDKPCPKTASCAGYGVGVTILTLSAVPVGPQDLGETIGAIK